MNNLDYWEERLPIDWFKVYSRLKSSGYRMTICSTLNKGESEYTGIEVYENGILLQSTEEKIRELLNGLNVSVTSLPNKEVVYICQNNVK